MKLFHKFKLALTLRKEMGWQCIQTSASFSFPFCKVASFKVQVLQRRVLALWGTKTERYKMTLLQNCQLIKFRTLS